jgi:hypothetical protein
MTPKHPSESLTTLTDLVLPSETNPIIFLVNYWREWIVLQVLLREDIREES